MTVDQIVEEVGVWSEIKLSILREYLVPYSTILSKSNKGRFKYIYVDGFAGSGINRSRASGEIIAGSATQALVVKPPFSEYHFVDLDNEKANQLQELVGNRSDVFVYEGNCNSILLEKVFPRILYNEYKRGLCFLDPYGLHLDWEVLMRAGEMGSLELVINFPTHDMNRGVIWRDPSRVNKDQLARMDAFWGDRSWIEVAYTNENDLFGFSEKAPIEDVATAFRKRLETVAGFKHVITPMPMRNSKGNLLYYLMFATQNATGAKIMNRIFKKYQHKGFHRGN